MTPTQCVTPFIVSTNMTYNIEVGAFVKSAPAYAHEALNTVGYSSFTSGCVLHALQVRESETCISLGPGQSQDTIYWGGHQQCVFLTRSAWTP